MNKTYTQYADYTKPWFSPPPWIFGPVWSVLYILIAISFGWVFVKVYQGQIPKIVALPFVLNLLANFSFTPVQFGLNNLPLASLVILIVLLTLPWAMWATCLISTRCSIAQKRVQHRRPSPSILVSGVSILPPRSRAIPPRLCRKAI